MRALLMLAALLGCPTDCLAQGAGGPISPARAGELERGIADFPRLDATRDWPWWRGPTRNGVAAAEDELPTRWSESQHVRWKTPVPGRGHASPIVVGNRVYLATADEDRQTQSVVAFDRATGEQAWQTIVNRRGFPAKIESHNTHASPTMACDGERLFVTFFHHESIEATALDLEGSILWQANVGRFDPRKYEEGYAPSPCLYRGLLLVALEYDGDSFLAALDRASGEEVWRTPRPTNVTYSPPVVARIAGRDQLLISGSNQVASYDPNTGRALWSARGGTLGTAGTIVWDGELVFASGGYPDSITLGVRGDGSGEVLWSNNRICYEQSMLAHEGYLYGLTDNGVLYCWRGEDGQEMWRERLRGPVSASPVLAGGCIYQSNELGTTYVYRPTPRRFELIAENRLGDESFASPAICGGQIFLRVAAIEADTRQEYLYCLEQ